MTKSQFEGWQGAWSSFRHLCPLLQEPLPDSRWKCGILGAGMHQDPEQTSPAWV